VRAAVNQLANLRHVGTEFYPTLLDGMKSHETGAPIHFDSGLHGEACILSRSDLWEKADQCAKFLLANGVHPGDRVFLLMPTGPNLLISIFACWMARAVVVIGGTSRPLGRQSLFLDELKSKITLITPRVILTENQSETFRELGLGSEILIKEVKDALVTTHSQVLSTSWPKPSDLAILQFTSGSTGSAKATKIYHDQLVENIRSIHDRVATVAGDKMVSWFPLYHDMGFIAAVLAPLYANMPIRLIPTESFARDPSLWLKAITEFRATASMAPPFALSILARRVPKFKLAGVNLSALRHLTTGSEPIVKHEIELFIERFKDFGLKEGVVLPCYGMSEATVGVSICPPGRSLVIQWLERTEFQKNGRAVVVSAESPGAYPLVAVGPAFLNIEYRIMKENGETLPEATQGLVFIRGTAITRGYWGEPDRDRSKEWFNTGDLGIILNGELYITGRLKEVMKKGGVSYSPAELEKAAEKVSGLRAGRTIAFSYLDQQLGREQFVLVGEVKLWKRFSLKSVAKKISESVSHHAGIQMDEILLLTPGSIPKTSSGKLQRSLCKELYFKNSLRRAEAPFQRAFNALLRFSRTNKEKLP
jgi:acyl-CoA synthetase (AMP-forming)/AMP-acid ligase II